MTLYGSEKYNLLKPTYPSCEQLERTGYCPQQFSPFPGNAIHTKKQYYKENKREKLKLRYLNRFKPVNMSSKTTNQVFNKEQKNCGNYFKIYLIFSKRRLRVF